jgi:hypothetical protein
MQGKLDVHDELAARGDKKWSQFQKGQRDLYKLGRFKIEWNGTLRDLSVFIEAGQRLSTSLCWHRAFPLGHM